MGAGIAQVSAVAGFRAILADVTEAAAEKGVATVAQNLDRLVAKQKITATQADLALADLIGLDVLLSVTHTLHTELGDPKYRPAPFLGELVAAGYLGRKSGRGVYRY
ncbi:MAG: hypothetical protein JOY66_04765 [Acetobacteraceae bacterium]|nr:hypothetical protein [Acetobacteraceae bacterium]